MSLRILIVSNAPWAGSGFGTQAAQLGRSLRDHGHQVAFFANYGLAGSKTVWEGFTVFPAAISPAGDDLLHGHADAWGADVVLVLFDAFTMDGRIQRAMRQLVLFWQPVDCEPLGRGDFRQFQASGAQPVAMSRFGERVLAGAGLDPWYAPHAIDTRYTFLPADQLLLADRQRVDVSAAPRQAEARGELRRENGLPEDAFLVGMNVHNKDAVRKAVWEQMSAFALFHRNHSDTLLLCHTLPHPVMSGNDLLGMAEFLGIGDAVRWADPYSLLAGDYTPGDMARWYAQLDLYSGAARAEGFGVPLVEAQACGVPVVTTRASAMEELAGPGWMVGGQPYWQAGHQSTWVTPDIGELAHAYELAYAEAGTTAAADRSVAARAFAAGYDAAAMFEEHWVPIWERVEHALSDDAPRDAEEGELWTAVH